MLQSIDEEINYDTKSEIVNTILSSSAFDDIYDTLIFSNLNNMRSWQNRYNEIDDMVIGEKIKLNERYFNMIKDFKSNTYNVELILNSNMFLIELSRFKQLLDERCLHLSTLIECRKMLLIEIKKHFI